MSRKTTAALLAALGVNFALAGGALMLANLNKPTGFDLEAAFASSTSDLAEVAGVAVDPEAGHVTIPLKAAQFGGNARVTFSCGKKIPSGREVHEGTWDHISGAVLYKPEGKELLAIEAVFDTRSLRTDTQALTTTVTSKEKWFDIESHPTAIFSADTIQPINTAESSETHHLIGTFTLNGITKPIEIPVTIEFSGQGLSLDAAFVILRSDYSVEKRESSLAGSVGNVVSRVEDEVEMRVRVTASPDPAAVISELAKKVEKQEEQLRRAEIEIKLLNTLDRRIELLEEQVDQAAFGEASASPSGIETDGLPKSYTDQSPDYSNSTRSFGMILVPGDDKAGVAPFYMSMHEVTWGMLDIWMYLGDLDETHTASEKALLIEQGLRPSPLYEDPAQFIQVPDKENPAIAMSMLTAKSYCKWLSEKTGRKYRLPTIDEWRHAARIGGGVPQDIDAAVWHKDNVEKDIHSKPLTGAVGSKQPNALGIYDLFGNASEWVTGTGTDRVVVGGHFQLTPDQFSVDWKAVEDIDVWNATHPQLPPGRFWISDFYFTGIRLVCEPASVVANPPTVVPAD